MGLSTAPKNYMKDYQENYKKLGHDAAIRILRQRIVADIRYGHAWFMAHRKKIEAEVIELELRAKK